MFLWLICRNRVMTNAERACRHFTLDASYPVCGHCVESIDHLLRSCPAALEVWHRVVRPEKMQEFLSMEIGMLWRPLEDSGTVLERSYRLQGLTGRVNTLGQAVSPSVAVVPSPSLWWCPPLGWHKVNTDGARNSVDGSAACGGVIRNHLGQWQLGFYKFVGCCSVVEGRLWGILVGLSCAWEMGLRRVILEVDSRDVVRLLDHAVAHAKGPALLLHVLELWKRAWELQVQHGARSGNGVADRLAKLASAGDYTVHKLDVPPVGVAEVVEMDGSI